MAGERLNHPGLLRRPAIFSFCYMSSTALHSARKLYVLYVVNKRIPATDYRLLYSQQSKAVSVVYGLPGKPEQLEQERYVHMGFGEGLRLAFAVEFFRLLWFLLLERRHLDFVHFFSTNLILFGPLLAKAAGVPCLITVTGFGRVFSSTRWVYQCLRPFYLTLLWIAIRISHRVLFQNRGDLASATQRFPNYAHKLMYIGSAIEMPIVRHKHFTDSFLRVILVARLMPDKGIDEFLEVAHALHQQGFEFILIGPPSGGFDNLLQRVQQAHAEQIIDYKGELDVGSLREEYSRAHILFFPSHAEGMARVMLEAGFANLCPVAYNIPANQDLVREGGGFLVAIRDAGAAAKILLQLNMDRLALANNARAYQAHILNRYNIDGYTERLDTIMMNLARELKLR